MESTTTAQPVPTPTADGCVAILQTNTQDVLLGVMSAKYNAAEAVTDFTFSANAQDLTFVKFELTPENEEPSVLTTVESMARAIVSTREHPSQFDIKFSYFCGDKEVVGSLEMAEKFVKDLIAYSKHVVTNRIEESIQMKFCDRSFWPSMVAVTSLALSHGLKCNGSGVWTTYTQGIPDFPGYQEGMELCALITPSGNYNIDFVLAGVRGQFEDISPDETDELFSWYTIKVANSPAEFYAKHKLTLEGWYGSVLNELKFDNEPNQLIIG